MTTLLIQSNPTPLTVCFPPVARLTDEEFYQFCQANPELRIEQNANGEIIVMSPAFSDTGNRNFNLVGQFARWVEADGTGIGFDSSAGFTLPNGARRAPDLSWIQCDRWDELTPEQQASFAPICPDFVIELRSASDSLASLQAKLQEYIDNGASLGWLIDRKHRTVHRYRPSQTPEILENPETVSGDPELPGFVLSLKQIW